MSEIHVSAALPAGGVHPVRATVGAVTTTIACVLPVFLLGGLAVQMGAELRFSPAGLGLAVSVYFGGSAIASVPSGALVERYGPAVIARGGILLAAATLLAIGVFARSFALLLVLLALSAVANALGQLASNSVLARHVPVGRQGVSFGLKQAAIPLSTLLAGIAVPTVALTVGWRWAFVAAAGAALTALPLVPNGHHGGGRTQGSGGERATAALIVIGGAALLASASAGSLGTFLVDSAVERGLGPGLAGLALTFGSTVCVAARVLGGHLADRGIGGRVSTIGAMLVVGSAGLALLAVGGTVPLVAGVVLGFGLGWAWPGLMNFAVVRLHPQAPAAATSITQTGVYAGGCLGPLGLGPLAAYADYPAMWRVAAVAMLLAAALMFAGGRMLHHRAAA
ncbi:MAG TPA: MFS transporter [Micromonospora sp.]|nr:MFS transporter [Micromonospora sp.]